MKQKHLNNLVVTQKIMKKIIINLRLIKYNRYGNGKF